MSIDRHSFRLINTATNLLKFDFNDDDDNPIYTFDGLYVCKVSNGIPMNITLQCNVDLKIFIFLESPIVFLKLKAQRLGKEQSRFSRRTYRVWNKTIQKSFLVNWISGFDGGFPQQFVIKYRFVEDETWSVHRSNKQTCTSERMCALLIKAVFKYGQYVFYMYSENKLGKSSNTKPVTIEINTLTKENQDRENHIFSQMTEKLLISLTSTLLVIVIVISCCLFGRQYRINRINAPSFSNQASTSNAAIRNGHYEEIDGALEINVNNSLSPGNDQIENLEIREATQISMPTSIQTIQEIAEQTMRDMSMRVLTETTTTVIRKNQLKLIKETVRQVLSEKNDLQPNNTHSTSSTESEHDTNDENGYLNPYQPLNINVDSCEHPYTNTILKDDTLNICKREIKNYPIVNLSFHSENVTSEL
ncbi:IGSF9 [Mytilus edulis]|uniref:IGSF9 n=1 Tax=Mytilus edulis TaxID=6550 RepID=A0A8S3QJC7_MYTED|nr:IGSF9 [Mytilus edulis]